jgi:hypothetical protein
MDLTVGQLNQIISIKELIQQHGIPQHRLPRRKIRRLCGKMMSAESLKQLLQQMPETGANGFEGLVCRLLEIILDEPFVLTRSGDQPSGDAHMIMSAGELVCVVPGGRKAHAAGATLNGPITPDCPASLLRSHPAATLFLDHESAAKIRR